MGNSVAAPDGAVSEIQGITGRRYKATRGGMYDNLHPVDERALLAAGGFRPTLGGPARGGYACPCGFRPLVRKCSRCGHVIIKESA